MHMACAEICAVYNKKSNNTRHMLIWVVGTATSLGHPASHTWCHPPAIQQNKQLETWTNMSDKESKRDCIMYRPQSVRWPFTIKGVLGEKLGTCWFGYLNSYKFYTLKTSSQICWGDRWMIPEYIWLWFVVREMKVGVYQKMSGERRFSFKKFQPLMLV